MVIKYCHELGVVHRDVKPENVLRTSSGQLKLADFGLSTRFAKGQSLSGVVGSPSYVAPEVLAGTYSEKVDVWGAGVLLYALLMGILPFRGESVKAIFEAIQSVQLEFHSEKWQSISGLAKDLLSRMLSRDVEKRLSPQEILSHPWIKFHTESKVKIPASMPKRRKRILAAKGERSEESPLPLTPCKRERRAPCTNSIPTEYGEDESFFGPLQGFPHPKQPELHIRAAGKYDLVDALAAAISQIRLSEPKRKRSRLCVLACPVPLQCSSNIKTSLCTAF
jgi:serine/threonine protein kinase